jgi:hypothetical protein
MGYRVISMSAKKAISSIRVFRHPRMEGLHLDIWYRGKKEPERKWSVCIEEITKLLSQIA